MNVNQAEAFAGAVARLLRARSTVSQRRDDMRIVLRHIETSAEEVAAAVCACEREINGEAQPI